MNINRHNYEEWLLLYADNELSPVEKQQVEQFLEANPDLQEELILLQQSTLTAETISFDDKESLLKTFIIDEIEQEQLLLLLDDALTQQDASVVQARIETSKTLSTEWALLQKAKLDPADKTIFPDKPSLYRKEKDRIVPMTWWRVAAAALLIGFGTWGGIRFINKTNSRIEATSTVFTKAPTTPLTGDQQQQPLNNIKDTLAGVEAVAEHTASSNPVKTPISTATTVKVSIQQPANSKDQPTEREERSGQIVTAQEVQKIGVENALQIINRDAGNKVVTNNVPPSTNDQQLEENTINNSYVANAPLQENNVVRYASFDEDDNDEKPRKRKGVAFFKQLKRVIERKANIKTGDDDVKIANISFAMH